jgi:hypothetical protein
VAERIQLLDAVRLLLLLPHHTRVRPHPRRPPCLCTPPRGFVSPPGSTLNIIWSRGLFEGKGVSTSRVSAPLPERTRRHSDAKSSLGDAKSSLGDAKSSRWVTL